MIRCGNWPAGVCSWSLGNNLEQLKQLSDETGLDRVHLSLEPVLSGGQTSYLQFFLENDWKLSATMIAFEQEDYSSLDTIRRTGGIVPDINWPVNRDKVFKAVDITSDLPTDYLEFHFGFIDTESAAEYDKFKNRVIELADYAAKKGVTMLMETGQETAEELLSFLEDLNHTALAVNFDPANMILYNKGVPVDAVKTLSKYIKHIHAKDALYANTPGTWGSEVPWGEGQVNTDVLLKTLKSIGFEGAIAVEREAGQKRMQDIIKAFERLSSFEE